MNNMIKKILALILFVFLCFGIAAAENFTIVIGGSYLSIADNQYDLKYGGKKYFPEGKLSMRFTGNLYLWGSFGFVSSKFTWKQWSNKGVAESDLQGKSVADKMILAGGLGYYVGYIAPGEFSIKLEAGLCSISDNIKDTSTRLDNSQTVGSEKSKQSGLGFRGNFGVTYGLYKNFFAELSAGYLYASDTVDDQKVNLGGLRASLGIGLKF